MKYALLLLMIAGCGNSTTAGREPDEYTGCGTDENWRTFGDQEPLATKDDTQAPFLTSPMNGGSVSVAAGVKLTWQIDMNDVGAPDGDVPHDANSCPEYNTGGLQTLHLPPISGDVYDLQFTVDGKVAWRVITTLQEWGAPPAPVSSWVGKKVSLSMWRMSVLRNDVKQGPYTSTAPYTFTVMP